MKLQLPQKNLMRKRQIAIYAIIVIVCIISIMIAFYVQFYSRFDIARIFGIESEQAIGKKTQEESELLISEFDNIFTNSINLEDENETFKKKEEDKGIVYSKFEKKETKLNSYDIEVYVPYINIAEEKIEEYNKQIQDTFITKTESVLKSENKNIIYTVEYASNIQNGILSLIIRSNLKEGSSAQRVIIQTYNYDLRNHKEISLEEMLKIEQLEVARVQSLIDTTIQAEQKKVEDLKKLGYNIYSRDISSKQYNIKNTNQYYLTKDVIYIIYAYGNEKFTSEMDLIVL